MASEQPSAEGQDVQNVAIPAVNQREQVPTIYMDAVQGVMISPQVVKISLVENYLQDDGSLRARYVVNLAMPYPQLRAIGQLLLNAANETEAHVNTMAEVHGRLSLSFSGSPVTPARGRAFLGGRSGSSFQAAKREQARTWKIDSAGLKRALEVSRPTCRF